jgi:uncharacterized spore protein YtfJ
VGIILERSSAKPLARLLGRERSGKRSKGAQRVDVQEMVSRSQDTATVRRVYGEPYEKDGTTVIPAARVSARGGSGAARGGEHSGGGFRSDAEPVGAFVIRNGEVEWKPVFDLSSVVRRGQLVGFVALLVLWELIRAHRER